MIKQTIEETNEKGNHTLCMITSRELVVKITAKYIVIEQTA